MTINGDIVTLHSDTYGTGTVPLSIVIQEMQEIAAVSMYMPDREIQIKVPVTITPKENTMTGNVFLASSVLYGGSNERTLNLTFKPVFFSHHLAKNDR